MVGDEPSLEKADAIAVFDQVMSTATPCTIAWEEVGLSALRTCLDEQALAVAEHQESSLESRRALAAQAKAFRLSVEAEMGAKSEMRAASGELVRAFKGEIDALTTRSRFAEGAFLALYKLLREAPDPAVIVQALETAARAAVDALEGRNRTLEEQRQEALRQVDAVRATAAARGGALTAEELQEERRVLRTEVAAEQAETEQMRLQMLQDAVQEELLLAQRQAEQERAAGQAQQQVLQQEVERLESRAAVVEEEAGRTHQLEEEVTILESRLRGLQEKVGLFEAEHQRLATRATNAIRAKEKAMADCEEAVARAENAEHVSGKQVTEMKNETIRLRRELETRADAAQVEGLREKIRILEGVWGHDEAHRQHKSEPDGTRIHQFASASAASTAVVTRLGAKKGQDSTPDGDSDSDIDYHDDDGDFDVFVGGNATSGSSSSSRSRSNVKKSGLTTAGRNSATSASGQGERAGDGSHDRSGASVAGGLAGGIQGGEGGSLTGHGEENDVGVDAWLISYNRRLKGELERLRGRTRLAEERLGSVEDLRAAQLAELAERRQDVQRLEQDLVDAHQVVEAGKTMLRAFQSGPVAQQFGKLIGGGGSKGGGVGDTDRIPEDDVLEGVEEGGVTGPEGFSAADRLLGAVKRQRERFRKEALRREREASLAKGNAEQLSRENQELKRENMHLYKKIRYVMSYGSKGGGGLKGEEAERITESKYERIYEDGLDPFKEFDSQEKAARRDQMGFLESLIFRASRIVLQNRFRRYVLLAYLLVLHFILLLILGGGNRGVAIAGSRNDAGTGVTSNGT